MLYQVRSQDKSVYWFFTITMLMVTINHIVWWCHVTNEICYISICKRLMRGSSQEAPTLKVTWPVIGHVTYWQSYTSTFTRLVTTKLEWMLVSGMRFRKQILVDFVLMRSICGLPPSYIFPNLFLHFIRFYHITFPRTVTF